MSQATLDGKPIALDDAYAAAAKILGAARSPVVAGLSADVPGARAAILLAERLRGAYDHLASADSLADLDAVRSFGGFSTTPNEARVRGDVVLLIGSGLTSAWPTIFERLALGNAPRHGSGAGKPRKILWLGGTASEAAAVGAPVELIPASTAEIAATLGVWRARLGGRRVALDAEKTKAADAIVETLKGAHFGVAIWSAAALEPLTVESIQALLTDLNTTLRFTGIAIGARSGASGVGQASGWMTGFPVRTGFGRARPEHDPWRFEAARLVDSGEADAALWIAAHDGEAPPWSRRDIPLVTLGPAGSGAGRGLFIAVGRPGVDHDAVEFSQDAACMTLRAASAPGAAPTVAAVVAAIDARISEVSSC